MSIINTLNLINKFKFIFSNKIRDIYLNSSLYNKKISKLDGLSLVYKPNPSIFDCLVKYKKKKHNINNYQTKNMWSLNSKKFNEVKYLHNFYWLYSIDLKSSNEITQSIIEKWIDNNKDYNSRSWEMDLLSKRVISWISNSHLTYNDGKDDYKKKFNFIIRKQVNHLKNEINRSKSFDDKLIGCTAIILAGLAYQDKIFLLFGFNLLKKISNHSLDTEGFPKSRSLRQLVFYLKYLVLIRELLKDSQKEIPDYLEENIYYLGQAYNLFFQNSSKSFLFNGNHEINNDEFNSYLKLNGYNFKFQNNEISGYIYLKNQKSSIIIDVGSPPEKIYSQDYQSGIFSFEFLYLDTKIITNSGYYQKKRHQLNTISRSSASHSTLILDNSSITKFRRNSLGKDFSDGNFRVFNKKYFAEKDKWMIEASHDGYQKMYGVIHNRKIEFLCKKFILSGTDTLFKKNNFKKTNFEIRFHLTPGTKVTKTIDQKNILIETENTGWKFSCLNYSIDVETGLYFGKKNTYIENQSIFISGFTNNNEQKIFWKLEKI